MKQTMYLCMMIVLVLSSCKKNNDPDPAATNIYVAGYAYGGTNNIYACYWKNGTKVELTPSSALNDEAEATGIAMQGNDIYVAGYQLQAGGNYRAVYWKNNTPTYLSNGTYDAGCYAITISGTDIYLCGAEEIASGKTVAKYWRNGVATSLTDGSRTAALLDIAVNGADVHAIGYEYNSTGIPIYKYWKNGVPQIIATSFPFSASFKKLTVINNDVYIAGVEYDPSVSFPRAVYYKNGNKTWLTDGSNSAEASKILINGTDIYIVGYEVNTAGQAVACYWKNGVKTTLGDGLTSSILTDGFFKGTDLYLSGIIYQTTMTNTNRAYYWKNGSPEKVTTAGGRNYANAIYVQ